MKEWSAPKTTKYRLSGAQQGEVNSNWPYNFNPTNFQSSRDGEWADPGGEEESGAPQRQHQSHLWAEGGGAWGRDKTIQGATEDRLRWEEISVGSGEVQTERWKVLIHKKFELYVLWNCLVTCDYIPGFTFVCLVWEDGEWEAVTEATVEQSWEGSAVCKKRDRKGCHRWD